MSDISKTINALLGAAYQTKFHIPAVEDPSFQYDAAFGRKAEGSIQEGLLVRGQSAIEVLASFDGLLYYSPAVFQDPGNSLLTLAITPAETLAMRAIFSTEPASPAYVRYAPVDDAAVKAAAGSILKAKGIVGAKAQDTLQSFMSGESSIPVDAGTSIGKTAGNSLNFSFHDGDGYALHPLYTLWRLSEKPSFSLKFEPQNSSLSTSLGLAALQLAYSDGQVTKAGAAQTEAYQIMRS